MTTLALADARAQLSKLVTEAANTHERFDITRKGPPCRVLLRADDYDVLCETIEVLSDVELIRSHAEGMRAIEAGDVVDTDELAQMFRQSNMPRQTD